MRSNVKGRPRRLKASLVELLCSRVFQCILGYSMRMKLSTDGSYKYTDMKRVKTFEYESPGTTLRFPEEDPSVGLEGRWEAYLWRWWHIALAALRGLIFALRRGYNVNHSVSNKIPEPRIKDDPATRSDFPDLVESL